MATYPDRDVTVGAILSRAGEVLKQNVRPALLFLAVFTLAASMGDMGTHSLDSTMIAIGGLWQLLVGIGSIIGIYLLMEAMLTSGGLQDYSGGRRYLPYLGQSILMGLGVALGLILLIVPGLILAARWSLAAPLLIGRGERVFDALGKSWELTRGHAFQIVVAAIVLFAGFIIVIGVIAAALGEQAPVAILLTNLLANLTTVLSTAFVVALLGLIDPPGRAISDIFA